MSQSETISREYLTRQPCNLLLAEPIARLLITRTGAASAVHLGDLDPAGVRILIGVNARWQVEGQAPLRPHRGLYDGYSRMVIGVHWKRRQETS